MFAHLFSFWGVCEGVYGVGWEYHVFWISWVLPYINFPHKSPPTQTPHTGVRTNEEREQTLNQLLTEIDGFEVDLENPVVFMAATNRADLLDPALLRAGRFDRKVRVTRPDADGRFAILKVLGVGEWLWVWVIGLIVPTCTRTICTPHTPAPHHTNPLHITHTPHSPSHTHPIKVHARRRAKHLQLTDDDLYQLAKDLPGLSGAELENILNEAALEGIRNGTMKIGREEVYGAIDRVLQGIRRPALPVEYEVTKRLAAYEAGRGITAHVLRQRFNRLEPVERVSMVPRGEYVVLCGKGGGVYVERGVMYVWGGVHGVFHMHVVFPICMCGVFCCVFFPRMRCFSHAHMLLYRPCRDTHPTHVTHTYLTHISHTHIPHTYPPHIIHPGDGLAPHSCARMQILHSTPRAGCWIKWLCSLLGGLLSKWCMVQGRPMAEMTSRCMLGGQ